MSIDEVKNTLLQQKAYLNDKYFVKGIGVFGSVAKSQDTTSSDIDLLVEFAKTCRLFSFFEVRRLFKRCFKKRSGLGNQRRA